VIVADPRVIDLRGEALPLYGLVCSSGFYAYAAPLLRDTRRLVPHVAGVILTCRGRHSLMGST